jgi:predicted RNA-binding protein YlqC (UPF0109 family)
VNAFAKLRSTIAKIAGSTKVVLAELPPTTKKGAAAQITLFNYKLPRLADTFPEVTVMESNPKDKLRQEILDENDELLEDAIKFIGKELSRITPPDVVKPTCSANLTTASIPEQTYKLTELIQLQQRQIGRVIGAQGSTITKLSKKYSVQLRVGKWSEPKRDNKHEMENKMDGVIGTGNFGNVKTAAEEIHH